MNLNIEGQTINLSSFSNKNFRTKNSTRNETPTIVDGSMGSFTKYSEQVSRLYNDNNLEIDKISKLVSNNKTYLLFHSTKIPNAKNKDLNFTYNSKTYSVKYSGNSEDFVILVDNSEGTSISDISYNNVRVNFNGTITQNNTQSTSNNSNAKISSVSLSGNNLTVNFSGVSFNTSDKLLVTIKPDENVYTSDLSIFATNISGSSITINDVKNKLNKSFNEYWVTSVLNTNTGVEYFPEEDRSSFKLSNQNLEATISHIKFELKDATKNTFVGSINLNVNDDVVEQLRDKYIKISFLDKSQRDIQVKDIDYEKDTYGTKGNGFDYIVRNDRTENNRFIYLNFNELKNFEFSNLTEGMIWVLNKVEIVNKHNLRTIKDIDLTSTKKIGLQTLEPKLETESLTLNSGFDTNFVSDVNKQNNGTNNVTKEQLKQQVEGDNTTSNPLNIDFNFNNYKVLNEHYLEQTQKLFDLYNDYSIFSLKEEVTKFNFNNKSYNWGVAIEDFDQKFYEHNQNDTYKITKDLNNFNNLNSDNEAIINFNFFANPQNTNMDYWYFNQNAYAVSFSLDYLKKQPNKTIDNLEIKFVKLWEEIYKGHNSKIEKNDLSINSLDKEKLQKLMNQRIKVKVSLDDSNKLIIELKARKGVINDQIYLHNLSQEISTYIERAYNYLSVMYVEDNNSQNKVSYQNKNISENKLKVDGFLFEANNNFVPVNKYPVTLQNKFNIDVSTWRYKNGTDESLFNDEVLKKVTSRSIGINQGTGWMISKVKPNDPNDFKYYFATNRHVPTTGVNSSLSAPKDHNSKTDTSLFFSPLNDWYVDITQVWEASEGNKKLDGSEVKTHPLSKFAGNTKLRSSADLKIIQIDIKNVVDYYNNHKNNSS
ncbi:hypothetical protein [Mycoplasma leonicaptivi]|uniref:hypothetical protein n=1 Tax=Mycoplasma leonicaptivi TaxID=36742 RepID=UPI0004855C36|nr:hypothetical protein [Mycoplasma leonicaptivi]